ncbi:sigma-70 family RNA polymerase sigma factor, partial [Nonomuraea maritima]|uniref:sigma-70 family RNA polymerase sigma factor n=1 Tax=Nonomuraea maritima TaxID=683260 RepID=UPI0037223F6D
ALAQLVGVFTGSSHGRHPSGFSMSPSNPGRFKDLLQILTSLPIRQRQILAWTFAGYTPSEIADQLQMTPEAVRSSLKKARRAASRHPGTAIYRQGEGNQ